MREAVPAQKHRVPGGSDWRAGGVRGRGTKREACQGRQESIVVSVQTPELDGLGSAPNSAT